MNDNKPAPSLGFKVALRFGPLLLFFLANSRPALFAPLLAPILPPALLTGEHAGIFTATAVFIPAVLVALVISYALARHLPIRLLVTGAIVVVFGGLTLALQNETFIKVKPTIIYALFASVLGGGLLFGRSFIAIMFDQMFNLTPQGWRILTFRWALFFAGLAVLLAERWGDRTAFSVRSQRGSCRNPSPVASTRHTPGGSSLASCGS